MSTRLRLGSAALLIIVAACFFATTDYRTRDRVEAFGGDHVHITPDCPWDCHPSSQRTFGAGLIAVLGAGLLLVAPGVMPRRQSGSFTRNW